METKDLRFAVDKNDNKLMLRLLDGGADPNEGSAKVMFPLLVRFASFSSMTSNVLVYMALSKLNKMIH